MTLHNRNQDFQSEKSSSDLQLEAKEFFAGQFNCAQATFLPFALRLGLTKEIAAKLSQPFGGGMSQAGQACGAVSGGLLAIGLAQGTSMNDSRQKAVCEEVSKAFISQFKGLHGEITCPGLLGNDLNKTSLERHERESTRIQTPCSRFVEDAVAIVDQLLSIE